MLYDVFICHASEDKDDLVRPLAEALRDARVAVWFDEFELRVGDSLRRAIDRGLAQSRFGVVILSPAFFRKGWPQWELDGLVQRDLSQSGPLILPVWHELEHADVLAYSAPLADRVAVLSDLGPRHIATELLKVIRPEGSTLLIARDLLMARGVSPPVVTDDWWLDVVEYAGSRVAYESWEFPLSWGATPPERGAYIAWAAMQLHWTDQAKTRRICQLTEPGELLAFIRDTPGLAEACHGNIHFLAVYAPQLSLPGLGGEFEDEFAEWADEVLARREAGNGSRAYDSELNFRLYPQLESRPAHLACQWVQGELLGPHIRELEPFEYICWILSERSAWLPPPMRGVLLQGLKEWEVWTWHGGRDIYDHRWESAGQLFRALHDSFEAGSLAIPADAEDDLKHRMELAAGIIDAPESSDELVTRFLVEDFPEAWLAERKSLADEHAREGTV